MDAGRRFDRRIPVIKMDIRAGSGTTGWRGIRRPRVSASNIWTPIGGKRRAESHGGPLDERVSRNGRVPGQDATPSMARASLG